MDSLIDPAHARQILARLGSTFLLVIFFIQSTFSQDEIRFERITIDDGLSQSAITSMVQDKLGYLWIATLDGLNRYDGNSFKVYRYSATDSSSIPTNSVSKLLIDNQQNLWMAFRNGMSQYDPVHDNFKNYRIVTKSNIHCFVRDFDQVSDTHVLLSSNQGILEFNPKTHSIVESKKYSRFKDMNIFNLFFTKTSDTWVILEKEVWVLPAGSSEWIKLFDHPDRLTCLYDEKADEIYTHTPEKLLKYDPTSKAFVPLITFTQTVDDAQGGLSMLKSSAGELWLNRGSVHVYDPKSKTTKILTHVSQNPNSLSGNYATDLYETREGIVWVGTNGLGLNKYNPFRSVFGYLGSYPGAPLSLSDNFVTSIYTKDDEKILVGTLEGLDLVNIRLNKSYHFETRGSDGKKAQVFKMFEDRVGRVWLCTNKGLMKFLNNRVQRSGVPILENPTLNIYDALEISSNKFLLATNRGLLLWDPSISKVTKVHPDGSMVLMLIDGDYWIESLGKINLVSAKDLTIKKIFEQNAVDNSNSPSSLKCVLEDAEKNVWIGSWGYGLSWYDPKRQRFTHFREAEGLPNSVVYGILEDKTGMLWLSTNNGLCVFDKKTRRGIRNFSKNDGLQGNEFNTRAYFKSPSGMMYFGGVNGLTFFKPENALEIPSFIPKTIITDFYINNVRANHLRGESGAEESVQPRTLELEWHERNFSFDVAGLGFTFPSGTQYQYKLENFDDTWKFNGHEKRITFTNVPIGNYTLYIKSGNAFGDWEKDGLSIKIIVHGPIWQSSWFLNSAVVFLLASIYLIYGQRTRLLKKRAILLQKQVEERTRKIQRQQEEIAAQNEELTAQAETLENRNLELEKIKESLEKRVEERTRTLKRVNEDLVEQNTQLEQFTFITAHNIRGPLAQIKGLINFLVPGNDREVIKHLETSVQTLDEVITDLNIILNIRHGINKTFKPISIREQLNLALDALHEHIRSIHAEVDISNVQDIRINGLKPYLQSIFYNLIHNALKYSKTSEKPVINCSAFREDGVVKIIIEDNGIGIDMQYARDKIFKLYQRFHLTITGKGFGLFLVKTQVRAMGGKIEIESEPNRGTKFIIEFPKGLQR
jgi:signal transduction histidine kinase/ligand-binding sensor domain-containing protein